jgi:hypothetical protein
MIHIIEEGFTHPETLREAQEWAFRLPKDDTWFEYDELGYALYLLDIAKDFFHMPHIQGYEMHLNHDTPKMHFDKDEGLFAATGELSFPLCSIVWYPLVDMTGGELVFPNSGIIIKPKTNMLIVFRSDLLHDGKPFSGKRKSVGINPWRTKPKTYNAG